MLFNRPSGRILSIQADADINQAMDSIETEKWQVLNSISFNIFIWTLF